MLLRITKNLVSRIYRRRLNTGFTLIEVLVVALIIAIVATMAIPSARSVKKKSYENMAILKMQRIVTAEKRYYAEFGTFAYFSELVYQGFLPEGYSTRFYYNPLRWGESVTPFVHMYSLSFTIPSTPNSAFFKIDAVPEKNRLNLRTFNVNMFLDGTSPDRIYQSPPVREGLSEFGRPVTQY